MYLMYIGPEGDGVTNMTPMIRIFLQKDLHRKECKKGTEAFVLRLDDNKG